MLWIFFLILTILTWGSYNLFFKMLAPEMNYFLALLLIGIAQIILCLPFVLYAYNSGNIVYSMKGYLISIIMGFLLGLGTIFFLYAFKFGALTSVAIPSYAIGAMMIGVLGGYYLFSEPLALSGISGLILGVVSIILLTVGGR